MDVGYTMVAVKQPDGYKKVVVSGRVIAVHRLSAHIFLGLDLNSSKLQANHKDNCTSKTCWNPEHIYVGTHKQNIQDYLNKGHYNSIKTHCKRGHLLGKPKRSGKRDCRICKTMTNKTSRKKI